VEAPEDFNDAEAFRCLMVEAPYWAEGLPIAAKIRVGQRYSKSKPRKGAQVLEFKRQDVVDERGYADDF
jgi:hypothetical protein